MEDILKTIGNNIKNIRIKKGITQEQLAFDSGLHRSYIGHIEQGKRNFQISNLIKIADALSVPINILFK
jgi:transcriptional regulator with XRE-family HTH domain